MSLKYEPSISISRYDLPEDVEGLDSLRDPSGAAPPNAARYARCVRFAFWHTRIPSQQTRRADRRASPVVGGAAIQGTRHLISGRWSHFCYILLYKGSDFSPVVSFRYGANMAKGVNPKACNVSRASSSSLLLSGLEFSDAKVYGP